MTGSPASKTPPAAKESGFPVFAELLPKILWFGLVVVLVYKLYGPMLDKLNRGEITKLSVMAVQIEFARSEFGKANELLPRDRAPIGAADFGVLADRIKRSGTKLLGARALWVDDDNPTQNFLERRALSSLGISFDLARSTTEAQQLLDQADQMGSPYDFIISDFRRDRDASGACFEAYSSAPSNAGCDFLHAVIKRYGPRPPPVIFYSLKGGAGTPPGAFGATTRFDDLVQLVLDAVERRLPLELDDAAQGRRPGSADASATVG